MTFLDNQVLCFFNDGREENRMPEPLKPAPTADGREMQRRWSRAMGLGIDLAAGMLLFTFGGYWLDQHRHTEVFWTVCGMFMGLVYGGYEVWKVVRSMDYGASGGKAAGSAAQGEHAAGERPRTGRKS